MLTHLDLLYYCVRNVMYQSFISVIWCILRLVLIKPSVNFVRRGKFCGFNKCGSLHWQAALLLTHRRCILCNTHIHVATIRHDKIVHTDMIPTLQGMLSLGTTQWQQLLNQNLFRRTSYPSLCSSGFFVLMGLSWLATPSLQAARHCLLASRVWYGTEAKTSVVSYNNYTES